MSLSLRDYLWMNRKKFTATQFAERLGVHVTHLSKISNGQGIPSIHLAKKIEELSGSEVKWNELMEFCYKMSQDREENSKKTK